jgi:hypothetical protein
MSDLHSGGINLILTQITVIVTCFYVFYLGIPGEFQNGAFK